MCILVLWVKHVEQADGYMRDLRLENNFALFWNFLSKAICIYQHVLIW